MALTKVTGEFIDIGDIDISDVGTISLDAIQGDADANTSITFSGSDVITIATGGSTAATFNADQTTTFSGAISGTSATLTTADNTAQLTLISTDTDANQGPILNLNRNPNEAGADNDYLGQIYWSGHNDAGTPEEIIYSKLTSQILDASDGTEDANMVAYVMKGGTRADMLRLGPTEAVFNESSNDIDFRVESNGNANMLFVDGGNNRVGVGTGTPGAPFQVAASPSDTVGTVGISLKDVDNAIEFGLRLDATSKDLHIDRYYSGSWHNHMSFDRSSGNVGIGTASPFTPLHVNTEGAPDTSGNVTSGLVVSHGTGGNAIKIGVHDSGALNYIQSGYVNNIQVARNFAIFSGATEAMRIDTSGKVGIGESSPDGMLHIKKVAGTHHLLIEESNNADSRSWALSSGKGDLGYGKLGLYPGSSQGGTPGNTPAITFMPDLKVGIGATTWGGDGISFAPRYSNSNTTSQIRWNRANSTGAGTALQFLNNDTNVGEIQYTNSATSYLTSSDYRLKENVVTDWDATTLLKQLKPSKFNFISNADKTVQGFLAHEVSSIVPEAVSGTKDAVYTAEEEADGKGVEGQPKYQGIDHSKIVPLLVKTIQELEARIATLEG